MAWCLIPSHAKTFLAKLRSGDYDPARLQTMSSLERRNLFAADFGAENAKQVNASFEQALLRKSQQKALQNWVTQVAGLKPEVKRDLLTAVEKMPEALTSSTQHGFLADLAAKRLGFSVTETEAAKVLKLSQDVRSAEAAMQAGGDRMDYGRARVAFGNYVSELRHAERHPLADFRTIKDVGGFSKSIAASMDDSALLNQGLKVAITDPKIWAKNAKQSIADLVHEFGGKPVMDEVLADIYSRPNWDKYAKMKLAIENVEDAFPSAHPEKIPLGIGRAFKASETAYKAFLYRTRADLADAYLKIAEAKGEDTADPKLLDSMGKMINSLTGRGHLGETGEKAADLINLAFFSLRKVKSDLDFLTAHQRQKDVHPFVRKQALKNSAIGLGALAATVALIHAVKPDAMEIDPRSADFAKLKIGNTRYNLTAGMGALVTLFARIGGAIVGVPSMKSSTTGDITRLNEPGYGKRNAMDVLVDFFENKASPLAQVAMSHLKGQTFQHERPTAITDLRDLFTPLPARNVKELYDNQVPFWNFVGALAADFLGTTVNTYTEAPYQAPATIQDTKRGVELTVPESDRAQMKTNVDAEIARQKERLTENESFKKLSPAQQRTRLRLLERKVRASANKQERATLLRQR